MPLYEYLGSWRSYLSALDREARNVNKMDRINRMKPMDEFGGLWDGEKWTP
jgi:hypothetical protein